jgi:hypothetical protein
MESLLVSIISIIIRVVNQFRNFFLLQSVTPIKKTGH